MKMGEMLKNRAAYIHVADRSEHESEYTFISRTLTVYALFTKMMLETKKNVKAFPRSKSEM